MPGLFIFFARIAAVDFINFYGAIGKFKSRFKTLIVLSLKTNAYSGNLGKKKKARASTG